MTSSATPLRWSTSTVVILGLFSAGIGYGIAEFRPRPPVPRTTATANAHHPTETVAAVAAGLPHSSGWEAQWEQTRGRPNSPARARARAALLEELARTDPQRALDLAFAENNWLVRDQLRDAALRGWGAIAPDAASRWAMARTEMGDRMRSVCAVLNGAAETPEAAVRVALRLCGEDPQPSGDYGHNLINALVDKNGSFDAAARFAAAATMVDRQSYLLDSAYYQWAQHEPERALREVGTIADPSVRASALKGAIEGCADADPQKLADYARALPPGEDRSQVLGIALPRWVGKDPDAALAWINRVDPNPDNDKGVAAIALQPSFIEQRPDVAMDLTDNICDSARRILTKSNVFCQWAQRDPVAARRYAEAVRNPEYRESLLSDLAAMTANRGP